MTTGPRTDASLHFSHVQPAEADQAIATLVLSFAADPHLRWLFPDARQYLNDFPDVLQSFAGVAFAGDTVWKLDGLSAIALWLPPGAAPDTDAAVAVFERSVPADRLTELMAVFEQMDQAHPPSPHWYLAWIGIDPARQGRGLGSDLLQRCLDVIDGDHLPTFLDTPNPNTVPFYHRHGFDVVGEWAAGDCPPVVSMLRRAQ
jgi:GNAT superfamily N-acetyltransferase